MQKDKFGHRGWGGGGLQPIFFNWYLSNEKTAFVDKSRVELTIFFIEKISFSLKHFSGHFMGNPSLRMSEVLSYQKSLFTMVKILKVSSDNHTQEGNHVIFMLT